MILHKCSAFVTTLDKLSARRNKKLCWFLRRDELVLLRKHKVWPRCYKHTSLCKLQTRMSSWNEWIWARHLSAVVRLRAKCNGQWSWVFVGLSGSLIRIKLTSSKHLSPTRPSCKMQFDSSSVYVRGWAQHLRIWTEDLRSEEWSSWHHELFYQLHLTFMCWIYIWLFPARHRTSDFRDGNLHLQTSQQACDSSSQMERSDDTSQTITDGER